MTYNSSFNLSFAQSNQEEANNSRYQASVPIAVYRQLAEELNITQTRLKFTEQENRKLAQENEQLKQELTKVVQQGEDLKKLVNNFQFTVNHPVINTGAQTTEKTTEKPVINEPIKPKNKVKKTKLTRNRSEIVAEIAPQNSTRLSVSEPKESSGIFLAIALIFIVLTTFGAGFMVINSLLGNNK